MVRAVPVLLQLLTLFLAGTRVVLGRETSPVPSPAVSRIPVEIMDKFSRQTREVEYRLVRHTRQYCNTSGPDRDGGRTTGKCGGARQESG